MTYTTIIGLLTATDQIIKQAVERDINGVYPRELEKSKGKIFLYRSHNSGFSFEFLKEYPALIKAIPLAAISAFSGVLTFLSMRKSITSIKQRSVC